MRVGIHGTWLTALVLGASTLITTGPATVTAVSRFHPPVVAVGANQSTNWSGYNQGTLEQSGTLFTSIAGDWTVPTASQHKAGEGEYSSTWIGIGGGCVDASCTVTDNTLIQLGTELDVDADGRASYSAWWEIIPAPSVTISDLAVRPGDHMHAELSESAPGVWTMTLANLTTGGSFSQTIPYTSTHATAEWIEETPVVISSNGDVTVGPLPNLSTVNFDLSRTNGGNTNLVAAEEMQLVNSDGSALMTPSSPDAEADGFNDCSYSATCPAPGGGALGTVHGQGHGRTKPH